jgi:hypothetical protein
MSGIAALYNIPSTPQAFAQWMFAHKAHHLDIINQIYINYHVTMPEFILDPFNPDDPNSTRTWSYDHQEMHRIQNQILGIAGFDLLNVNWQDENEVAAWIELNAIEHFQASEKLRIG